MVFQDVTSSIYGMTQIHLKKDEFGIRVLQQHIQNNLSFHFFELGVVVVVSEFYTAVFAHFPDFVELAGKTLQLVQSFCREPGLYQVFSSGIIHVGYAFAPVVPFLRLNVGR